MIPLPARISAPLVAVALLCALGCVERRMVIITHPFPETSGAIVFDENNRQLSGGTPVDKPFTYYGKYRFRIVKDGYEPLVVEQRVRAPWYELPGLDFISENLIPWTIRDVRYFTYVLEKSPKRDPDTLYQDGSRLRDYGKTIGIPLPEGPRPPAVIPLLPPQVQ